MKEWGWSKFIYVLFYYNSQLWLKERLGRIQKNLIWAIFNFTTSAIFLYFFFKYNIVAFSLTQKEAQWPLSLIMLFFFIKARYNWTFQVIEYLFSYLFVFFTSLNIFLLIFYTFPLCSPAKNSNITQYTICIHSMKTNRTNVW